MTLEMGKPLAESKAEIIYAAEFFRWFSGEALRIQGDYRVAGNAASRVLVLRQPVGPSLLITPWNFPMAMGTRKVGPAIAAGCTMIIKPAQNTPLSMLALAADPGGGRAARPASFNIITSSKSSDVTKPLLERPPPAQAVVHRVDRGGQDSSSPQAAENVLRVSMELGGNAPFLVFEDADLDEAVEGGMLAKMRNIGEACTSANRFHVAESVAGEFAKKLADRMGALKIGRGTEEDVEGRPADRRSPAGEGGRAGEGRGRQGRRRASSAARAPDGRGYFYPPTVLANVPARRPAAHARRSSARSRRSRPSRTRRRRSRRPTTPSTAWSPTSSRATSSARCA